MGETNKFARAVNADVARYQAAAREQERQRREQALARAAQKRRDEAAKEQWLLRRKNHEGTDPDVLFGPGATDLCNQFIEFMGRIDFAGSTVVTDEPGAKSEPNPLKRLFSKYVRTAEKPYSLRAYAIARTGDREDRNVFLCEDGKIRQKMADGALQEFPLDSEGRPVSGASTSYVKTITHFEGMTESNAFSSGGERPVYRQEVVTVHQTLEDVLTGIALEQRRYLPAQPSE